jgi:N-acetylmuramoyl-L-alanine amidase
MGEVLRRGDRGPAVVALRAALSRALPAPAEIAEMAAASHAAFPSAADDVFDLELETRVRAFQQHRGLMIDGLVGPQTSRTLEAARWQLGDRILLHTPGHLMHGDDVAALQERLVTLGLLSDRVDSFFGPRTEAALRDLQRSLGLQQDGLCGPATLRGIAAVRRAVGGGDPWALRQQVALAHAGPSLMGKIVVLDPAGGGSEPGLSSGGLREADVAYDVARRVEGRLAAMGAVPVLSRGAANCPDLEARVALTDDVAADLVIGLHCDAHDSVHAGGSSTFYWGDQRIGARSTIGKRLAQLILRELVRRNGSVDLQAHARSYDMLRRTRMPAVRVELGYLTHPADADRLADPAERDVMAEAIVVAVQRLYLVDDVPTGAMRLSDLLEAAAR